MVRCAVGVADAFKVGVGLHQESALRPLMFAVVMERLTDEFMQANPWTIMFTDDIVIYSESREEVEDWGGKE